MIGPSPAGTESCPAWLFDLHARGRAMVLWFICMDGRRLRLLDEDFAFRPLLDGPPADLSRAAREIEAAGHALAEGFTERQDFWTGHPRRVLALRVRDLVAWKHHLARWHQCFPRLSWYNADLPPEQVYCYERKVFPLARCVVHWAGERLLALESDDDRWATDYPSPPLRRVVLRAEGSLLGARPLLRSLSLEHEGRETTWEEPEYLLPSFQEAVDRIDPDVILTHGGDARILPLLFSVARRRGFDLRLDREPSPTPRPIRTEGRSFMSYGRVLYSAPEYALQGRWHLDIDNSFMASQAGLEGVFEVARLSRIPAQRIGRRSIGTGITSVQLDVAWNDRTLIPWKKTHPEAWKSAAQLLRTDRGGLVYAPRTGFYDNVVELDFISMYPTIMARFNVSPETVNCACCRNHRVPEIGYTLCERREGLVSRALAPIIRKRIEFKRLRAEARARGDAEAAARWDHRQSALKWMLVCCFGYLGYRNARFGRIEAHEAVSAFSREILLRARELAEEQGWEMIHANVDCVYLRRPGPLDRADIAPLIAAINDATGLDIALEGIYRWAAFLPSRQVPDRPVPTRYFGVFEDGELKYRGIECRRGDMPGFVRRTQLEALGLLAHARDTAGYRAMIPALRARIAEWEGMLLRHEVPLDELALRGALSREPDEYRGNGRQAIAARQSARAGLGLHAGQSVAYYLTGTEDPDPDRRVRLASLADADTSADPLAYIRLLRRAMNALLWPAGESLDEDMADLRPPRPAPPKSKGQAENIQLNLGF